MVDESALLLTKLKPPPARPSCIQRPRLFQQVDAGAARRLSLITAPAGYGKTTLLSSWYAARASRPLSERNPGIGWLTLDAADNDPSRFWRYVVRALRLLHEQTANHPLLALEVSPLASIETFLTALLNAYAAWSPSASATTPSQTVLILDDYHEITNPAIHSAVAFLLEHLPPSLHLVIASRLSPPLPLTKLRAQDQLVDLGTPDLRFSLEEMADVLHRLLPLSFTSEQLAQLYEQTDGWIMPLHLAALAWRDHQNAGALVASVRADHHAIVEYLAAEIFERQPADTQRFLLATSVLTEFTGALCNAVLQQTNSQCVLEQIEREQLFLVPLDETHRWYRYHALFVAFLRNRLRQTFPAEMAVWHRRAADWHLEHDSNDAQEVEVVHRALPHLYAAQDWQRAADLIEAVAEPMLWQHGEVRTLLRWLEQLPRQVVAERPRLALASAWALTFTGQFDAAETALRQVECLLAVEDTRTTDEASGPEESVCRRTIAGEVLAVRARIAAFQDTQRASALTDQALERLPEGADLLRADLLLNLGYAQFRSHSYVAAARTFEDTRSIARRSGNRRALMLSSRYLALSYVLRAQLNDAATIYRQALRLATKDGQAPIAAAGTLYIGNAQLLYERNELDVALEHAQQGLALGLRSGEMKTLLPAYLMLAQIQQGLGDQEHAHQALNEAERLSDLRLFSWTEEDVAVARARLHLSRGESELAVRVLSRNGWKIKGAVDIPFSVCPLDMQLTWARIWLAQGRPDGALALLRYVLDRVHREQPEVDTLPILVIQALALAATGADEQTLALLAGVLPPALAQGYVRTFVDEGAPMAALLRGVMLRRPIAGVEAVLAAFPPHLLEESPFLPAAGPSPTTLSAREVEVMRLMAAGLSNQEIADQLVVALSTVRTHTKHIYRKLGVRGRMRAIVRATDLHVL